MPAIGAALTVAAELVEEVFEWGAFERILARRLLIVAILGGGAQRRIDVHLHGQHGRLHTLDQGAEIGQSVFLGLDLLSRLLWNGIGKASQADTSQKGNSADAGDKVAHEGRARRPRPMRHLGRSSHEHVST